MSVTISRAGFLSSVQDGGRRGFRKWGVSLGGALDAFALRVANAIVGNDEAAAGIETTFGTVRLEFSEPRIVAWCGGAFEAQREGEVVPAGHATLIRPGEKFAMTPPKSGARAWVAISGGIDVPQVLGSSSTDLRGEFGGNHGRTLRDGDRLSLGENSRQSIVLAEILRSSRVAQWTSPNEWVLPSHNRLPLRALPGDDAEPLIFREAFAVSQDSDRMGARLRGPPLQCGDAANRTSEAVVPGTVQVPPSGDPILLLGDCQTIGGYPKIAHVITVDLPIAAQLFPGANVRFQEVTLAGAHQLLRQREEDFSRFKVGIETRFG